MTDKSKRRELKRAFLEMTPKAGVYRLVNTVNGRYLLGRTTNLPSVESKLAFSKTTKTAGMMLRPMHSDIETFGIDAIDFEVLELLEVGPDASDREIKADLEVLESLWREKLDRELAYQ